MTNGEPPLEVWWTLPDQTIRVLFHKLAEQELSVDEAYALLHEHTDHEEQA